MMTRREFGIGIGVFSALASGAAWALPKKSGSLEVTYYYLPG